METLSQPPVDSRRWRAVLARSRAQDGAFVYAVRTTGVYCRPSCSARRPHRKNVVFFSTPQDAERAGYRACRKCFPKSRDADPVECACRYIEARLDEPLSLEILARAAGLSPQHLQRRFKARTGLSPKQWSRLRRVDALKERLRRAPTVTEALYAAGYGSPSRVYENGAATLGMSPAAYKKGGGGERIGYAVVRSPYGRLLIAATSRGVCRVALGASAAVLKRELRGEFPCAEIEPEPVLGELFSEKILGAVAGKSDPAIPLDLRASAFRLRVFHALLQIPRGETRSYTQIAAALGKPRAARGVARAIASNPLALAIPCHRVVGSDGALRGYRWGVARKKKLLEAEKKD